MQWNNIFFSFLFFFCVACRCNYFFWDMRGDQISNNFLDLYVRRLLLVLRREKMLDTQVFLFLFIYPPFVGCCCRKRPFYTKRGWRRRRGKIYFTPFLKFRPYFFCCCCFCCIWTDRNGLGQSTNTYVHSYVRYITDWRSGYHTLYNTDSEKKTQTL